MNATQISKLIKHRILVVDDHPIVRRGLRELLSSEPDLEVCGEAEDVAEALVAVETQQPDVVVVDLSLRSGHGLDLIRQLQNQGARARILVSTMHDESLYAERSLRAGASGFINKQESSDKIIDAIRQILRGEIYVSADVARRCLYRVQHHQTTDTDPIESLSNRELEVFELIGRGHSTKGIAERLTISPKTVETHCERVKVKLNLSGAGELKHRAIQWVLERD
jgi:DNA-binding NarL/FixJ family response regulator